MGIMAELEEESANYCCYRRKMYRCTVFDSRVAFEQCTFFESDEAEAWICTHWRPDTDDHCDCLKAQKDYELAKAAENNKTNP